MINNVVTVLGEQWTSPQMFAFRCEQWMKWLETRLLLCWEYHLVLISITLRRQAPQNPSQIQLIHIILHEQRLCVII